MIVLMYALAGFTSIPLALMDEFANGKIGAGSNGPGMFGK